MFIFWGSTSPTVKRDVPPMPLVPESKVYPSYPSDGLAESPCPDRLDLEPPAKRLLTVQGVSFQGAFSVSFLQLDVST